MTRSTPTAGSDDHLQDLYRELDDKLAQRLDAIEADYREQARSLEQSLEQRHRDRLEEARQRHRHRLQRARRQAEREAYDQRQQQLWHCQRACIDELMERTRRQLADQTPACDYLSRWLAEVSPRLSSRGTRRLRLSPAWAEQLGEQSLAVTTAPLLGGAVLEDPDHHLEVDGSWDQRLAALTPQLWQRWLDHVGTDDSN